MNRWNKQTLLYFAVVAFAIWGCDQWFEHSLSLKRNVRHYSEYLESMPVHLVSHFPKRIPNDSTARVVFSTGPLQANMFLQLRIEAEANYITEVEKMAQTEAIAKYQGGRIFDHFNVDSAHNYPTTNYYTNPNANGNDGAFPDHFTLYVLFAQQKKAWETSGIGVSRKTNTVVFWAEDD